MKVIRVALFASVFFALAACGLISVPIEDPFGLDGQEITVTVANSGAPDGIRAQVASAASGNFEGTVNDSPDATGTLTNVVTFQTTVVVSKAGGNTNAYPESITVVGASVAVSIVDNTTSVSDNASFSSSFVMTRDGDCSNLASPCTYTLEVPAGVSISLAIGNILNNDDSPNDVSATLTLDLDSTPGLEVGDTLAFTLSALEGSGGL